MKAMNQKFYVNLFTIAIALVISLSSAFIAVQPASAQMSTQAACQTYLTTTVCISTCVPSNPNGCGAGKWSYFCAYKNLEIYTNGKRVMGSAGNGTSCSTSPTCSSTCQ